MVKIVNSNRMNTSELIRLLVRQCGPEDSIPVW